MILKGQTKAFTLVELLVVIAVIGLLSSIIIVSLKEVRERAKIAKMESDLSLILRAVLMARHNEDKVLKDITGSGCSACSCYTPAECDYRCEACRVRMETTLRNLGLPGAMLDPWGRYYVIDENELEFSENPCRIDSITCAGRKTISIPFYSSQCIFQ